MLTATKDLMLPATVTGSWPRPHWYDGGLWALPLDTAPLDVKFRDSSSMRRWSATGRFRPTWRPSWLGGFDGLWR